MVSGFLFAQNLGFVVDGTTGNYTSTISEASDGTFTVSITQDSWSGVLSSPFYIMADYTTADGNTAGNSNWRNYWPGNNDYYGHGYRQDFGTITASPTGGAVTSTPFNIVRASTGSSTTNGIIYLWTIYPSLTANGTYVFTLDVYHDSYHEGDETLKLYSSIS